VLIVIFARLFLSESLDTRKIIGVLLTMFGALLVTLVDQT
jgi:EamA-like transporter family.